MGLFINETEEKRLRECGPFSIQRKFYDALKARTERNTVKDCLVQETDTQEWYHLCWERLSDASFLCHMEQGVLGIQEEREIQNVQEERETPEERRPLGERAENGRRLGRWVHDRVMELVRLDADAWIGPWYRERLPVPQGFLETSHITLAVCEGLDNAPFLFTASETEECRLAIREKGMLPCMRYCERIAAGQDHINNWFMVTLDGYGTAAALLGEEEHMKKAVSFSHVAASLFNRDSYGESLQYSNYACIHLAHFNEVLLRSGKVEKEEIELACYSDLMPWYAASYLYQKPLMQKPIVQNQIMQNQIMQKPLLQNPTVQNQIMQNPSIQNPLKDSGEISRKAYPRSINFGDSAAIFRVSGDILIQIAVRRKEADPRNAGLASWMFEKMYAEPELGPDELASFGFFNQFQYHSVLMLPDRAETLSPEQAGLPLSMEFETGTIISRDRWEEPEATVAIQAGYCSLNVASHRHKDQNSFQLISGNERMLVDPGHTCYRLRAQKEAVSEMAHNTCSVKKNGILLEQEEVTGNVFKRKNPGNRLLYQYFWGNVQIIVSDASGLYKSPVNKAVRIWVMKLPHMIFTADLVEAKEPVSVCTHFCVNNRDGKLKLHRASDQRLVFRRGGRALKLFEAYSETDGEEKPSRYSFDWTAMHDYYHPLENQEGQGKEGSVCRYSWDGEEGYRHIRIHTFVTDDDETIVRWHVYRTDDGFVRIEEPCRDKWTEIRVTQERLEIRNEKAEKETVKLWADVG